MIPDRSPDRPSEEEIAPKRIAADEKINPDEELDEEELKEKEEKGEARHNAQVIHLVFFFISQYKSFRIQVFCACLKFKNKIWFVL